MSVDRKVDEPNRWKSFVICGAVIALTILDLTKINVGLPSIDRSLGASDGQLQLLVSGYVLAFGVALVPAGRWGDVRSRKTMIQLGLALFAAASLVCALAPNVEVLLVGRLLQGVAAGIQMPQALGLVQRLFSGRERARAFGYVGSIIAVSTAVGPALGGVLSQVDPDFGWRLLFWINVPIALTALVAAARVLPGSPRAPARTVSLDLPGIVLVGVTAVALMLPFVEVDGISSGPLRWLWLVAAAGACAALVAWERRYESRGREPVLSSRLVSLPSFRNGLVIMATFFASISAVFFVIALYLQEGRGVTPLVAGLVNIPQAATSAVGAWIGSRLVTRFGRRLVGFGIGLVVLGVLALIPVSLVSSATASAVLCSVALGIAGVGTGLVIAPNQTITVSEVPTELAGVAASLTQVAQRVGTAIGIAAMSAIYFGSLASSGDGRSDYGAALTHSMILALALLIVSFAIAARDHRRNPGGLAGVPQ